MRVPLLRTQFRFLKDEEKYVSHFVVNATEGQVVFPLFGTHGQGASNLVGEILKLNR